MQFNGNFTLPEYFFSLLLKPREPVDSDEGVADADVGALVGGAGDDPVPDANDHARVPPEQVRGPGSLGSRERPDQTANLQGGSKPIFACQ